MAVPPPRADATATSRPGARALRGVLDGSDVLRVHLQPIVALDTGRVWGVEALSRFPGHPRPGPEQWFAEAVLGGRAVALEQVALGSALALLPMLAAPLRLTVNLSAEALLDPRVQAMLLVVPPRRVYVELTEHERVADYPPLLEVLHELRAAGVGLCVDDFGAGHSSLKHVLHLAPDLVKLDLALVQGIADCSRRQAIASAMQGLCRGTGAVLVAEGVETADDLAKLVELGIDHAQGFFLARPAAPDVVLPVITGGQAPVLVLR